MNPLVYNASLIVGLTMIGAGADITFGTGLALVIVGALILALTMFGAHLATRKG